MRKLKIPLLFIVVFLSVFSLLNANSTVDSLENILEQEALSPAQEADTKLQLIRVLKNRGPKADSLLDNVLAFCQQNKLLYYEAKSLYYRTINWTSIRKFDEEFLAFTSQVDSIAQLLEDPKDLPIAHARSKSYYHWWNKEFDQAIDLLKEALIYADNHDLNELHRAKLLSQLAHVLGLNNQFLEATKTYQIALKVPNVNKPFIYGNLVNLYRRLEDWDKMYNYSDTAIVFALENNSNTILSLMSIQKATALIEMSRFKEAETILLNSYDYVCRTTVSRKELYFRALLRSYIGQEKWEEGLTIEDTLPTLVKKYGYASVTALLGTIYLKKGNTARAIALCEEGKKVALEGNLGLYLVEACDCLHQGYASLNQHAKAYENLTISNETKEKLNEKEKVMNLSRALNQQELAQQEKTLLIKQQEKEYTYQARIDRLQLAGVFGLVLIGLSIVAIYQIRKRSQKINEQNEIISKSLEEKDILLREIHHRVKNNLQLVSSLLGLQGMSTEDQEIKEAINAGKSRVMSMALIHQDLYNREKLTSVNVKEYLEKLCAELISTYQLTTEQVKLVTDIQPIDLDVDSLIPLGLIINELLTNALKYAFPGDQSGEIHIKLYEKDNLLQLEVNDNGVGMVKEVSSNSSFGLRLIKSLLRQLDGEMQTTNQGGTQFQFQFKDYKKAA